MVGRPQNRRHHHDALHKIFDQYQSDIRRGIVYYREQSVNTLAYAQFPKVIRQKYDANKKSKNLLLWRF